MDGKSQKTYFSVLIKGGDKWDEVRKEVNILVLCTYLLSQLVPSRIESLEESTLTME